ncbi:MAG: helix-turn-helix domain-containing protein [Gammaproteobacteria bacterium]
MSAVFSLPISALSISDIGRLIRERRIALGLAQAKVASLAGLSRSRLNALEKNREVDGLGFHKLNALLIVLGLQLAISASHEAADVASHLRNAIKVPVNIKIQVPSID